MSVKLQQEIEDLRTRYKVLEAQQQWVLQIAKLLFGVNGPWMSPAKASPLIGWSRDRIMAEVVRAEEMRVLNKPWDVVYGVHYRNDQDLDSTDPTWKINVVEFYPITTYPPDRRPILVNAMERRAS